MSIDSAAKLRQLEDLLDIYADSQDYMTYYEVLSAPSFLAKDRAEKVEIYRRKRDEAREQIIDLFLRSVK